MTVMAKVSVNLDSVFPNKPQRAQKTKQRKSKPQQLNETPINRFMYYLLRTKCIFGLSPLRYLLGLKLSCYALRKLMMLAPDSCI